MSPYSRIVVGTDGSETAMRAVSKAARVAVDNGAALLIVNAYQPPDKREAKHAAAVLGQGALLAADATPGEGVLRDAAARAYADGVARVDTMAVAGSPVEVLDQVAAQACADLLVVGSVGMNTLSGRVLGSVPQKLLRRAGVDVLIAHTT